MFYFLSLSLSFSIFINFSWAMHMLHIPVLYVQIVHATVEEKLSVCQKYLLSHNISDQKIWRPAVSRCATEPQLPVWRDFSAGNIPGTGTILHFSAPVFENFRYRMSQCCGSEFIPDPDFWCSTYFSLLGRRLLFYLDWNYFDWYRYV